MAIKLAKTKIRRDLVEISSGIELIRTVNNSHQDKDFFKMPPFLRFLLAEQTFGKNYQDNDNQKQSENAP